MVKQSQQILLQEDNKRQIAKENFASWNDALKTKDPGRMAKFYSENATFLPTVSGKFKRGQLGAEQYFQHFLTKDPNGEIVQEEVQILKADCYLHSGMYNFAVGPAESRQMVEARFSLVWKLKDNQEGWEIIHHHSSVRPKA